MTGTRWSVVAVALLSATVAVDAQAPARYRDFALGGTLASVVATGGARLEDARTLRQRPALIQTLEWRPSRYRMGAGPQPEPDSVRQIVFSFLDDKLYRMVVDYDRDRTEGMTDADMIEAITVLYGPPVKSALTTTAKAPIFLVDDEPGPALATWSGAGYSVVLHRSLYASGFRLLVTSPRVEALARAADLEARRLDDKEAPQRVIAQEKIDAAAAEKARLANKKAFKG